MIRKTNMSNTYTYKGSTKWQRSEQKLCSGTSIKEIYTQGWNVRLLYTIIRDIHSVTPGTTIVYGSYWKHIGVTAIITAISHLMEKKLSISIEFPMRIGLIQSMKWSRIGNKTCFWWLITRYSWPAKLFICIRIWVVIERDILGERATGPTLWIK